MILWVSQIYIINYYKIFRLKFQNLNYINKDIIKNCFINKYNTMIV